MRADIGESGVVLGVPLGDLVGILGATTIKPSFDGNVLVADHEHYAFRVEVSPPKVDGAKGGVHAVVRLTANLPSAFEPILPGPKPDAMMAEFNAYAALGALYRDDSGVRIGARLSIYENEDAWSTLQFPLLAFTIIAGAEGLLGGIRRGFANEPSRGGVSEWTERDFEQVLSIMSQHVVCTGGGLRFTCEFGLGAGQASAGMGHLNTALFEMMGDNPHPELGGGLFCLLRLPHQIPDQDEVYGICATLNRLEMLVEDLPPHFGAWCPGRQNNLAYIMFLPNALHSVPGIAVNCAMWAAHRAMWANDVLKELGIEFAD
jgi:hypothetical protein